jgi:hypothetical protein
LGKEFPKCGSGDILDVGACEVQIGFGKGGVVRLKVVEWSEGVGNIRVWMAEGKPVDVLKIETSVRWVLIIRVVAPGSVQGGRVIGKL